MAGSDDDIPPPTPPPTQTPVVTQTPHTMSTIKLPILKKGEYDIWAMKMEHYLTHTNYPIWEVIQKGNGPVSVSTDTNRVIKVLPPKTAKEILARERERKAKTTLLMALPEDHPAKFHKMTDAKEMWEAIKSRFGVSFEDANQKFLRSLPSSWSQVSLVMRTKPGVDSLNFDDLYNNLRVFESDIDEFDLEEIDLKWHVAMISMRLKKLYKKTGRKLDFDVKKPVGFNKTKVECYNYHKIGHFAIECRLKGNQDARRRYAGNSGYKAKDNGRRPGKQEEPKALVTLDGEGIDWTAHAEDKQENFALMAFSNSGSDTEDEQTWSLQSIEIQAYTQALKKVKAQLVAHQKNQLCEETLESMREPVVNETNVVSQPKVWSDAPIIEEYESDSDDDYDDPYKALKNKGIVDSGGSRHLTGNQGLSC
ncbi:ribonuclease H-like domain-containing protein [Tanacetum coccineum]